jgi:hypothetical protein
VASIKIIIEDRISEENEINIIYRRINSPVEIVSAVRIGVAIKMMIN